LANGQQFVAKGNDIDNKGQIKLQAADLSVSNIVKQRDSERPMVILLLTTLK